jgi:nondiscriminating aspartyl-tRNA synthetase
MDRSLVLDCNEKISQKVRLSGWIQTVRSHGKIIFLDLLDRSGVIQVVISPSQVEGSVEGLRAQDVVSIEGQVNKRPDNLINANLPTGEIEIFAEKVEVLAKADELPFDMGGKDLDLQLPTLLDFRSLTLRHAKVKAIFKVQQTIANTYREFLRSEGFTEVFVPTIVPVATEGGSEVFKLGYYNNNAYMAQSPQQYKQMLVGSLERVFTIAHAYRAEPSVTTRHLSEYVSLDAEMGFIESFGDLIDMVEKLIKGIYSAVERENATELKMFEVASPKFDKSFPRIKMREAQQIVFDRTGRDNRNEPDLEPADEKEICQWAIEETGAPFVFITHYPTKKRPFYTYPDPEDPEYTLSFDLLGIQEEWVTGGQRINNYDQLLENVNKWGNKPDDFQMYLQAFKYGMPPEGGFAMGLERMTKDILGLANIREASLYPRDMERVDIRLSTKKD